MNTLLNSFLPQVAALLLGGLGVSLGLTIWSRTARGQARLLATSGWTMAMAAIVAVLAGVAAAYLVVRPYIAPGAGPLPLPGTATLFVVGAAVGLPLGLPGLLVSWREVRQRDRTRRIRANATKDERRAYAVDLVRQIDEATPGGRTLSAVVGGDGGRVLSFEGELGAREGERLTRALRQDLKELGFKRVEGTYKGKEWWTRV